MICWQLFLAFLQIGAFSFGGGYAAMPLIQSMAVDRYGWLTMSDFTDLVTIAEMTPGPIAVNAATFIGNQTAGLVGALSATCGVILPSCVFVTALAWLYTGCRKFDLMQGILQSLRPAVVSMILAAGITIMISTLFLNGVVSFHSGNLDTRAIVLLVAAFFILRLKKLSPITVMVLCGMAELGCQFLS